MLVDFAKYGYTKAYYPTLQEVPDGFEPVPVGEPALDEHWHLSPGEPPTWQYTTFKWHPHLIGAHFTFRIRKVTVATKWSCGHGRDAGTKACPVCAALYYRHVTT